MLIEIFTNDTYEQTPCDLENGIKSKKIPKTWIRENNRDIINAYIKARDMIKFAIMKDSNAPYMLTISKTNGTKFGIKNCAVHFDYKLDLVCSEDSFNTIEGTVCVDYKNNIIGFSRAYSENTEEDERKYLDYNSNPNGDIDSGNTDEDTICNSDKNEEYHPLEDCIRQTCVVSPTVELSPDSFSVGGDIIEVSCPEMEIGSVEESTFNIDSSRQAAQDAFMKNMSNKFKR